MSELPPTPEQSPEPTQEARAAKIISDLMDMLKDHPDYHGSGPIDEGYQFLRDIEKREMAQLKRNELERAVQAKFEGLSDFALMNRINRAEDFGYDDEGLELTRRARLMGKAWRWAQNNGRDQVVLYTPEDQD